jgi:hypothetical protein
MRLTFRRSVGNILQKKKILNSLNKFRFVHVLQETPLNLKLCVSVPLFVFRSRQYKFLSGYMHIFQHIKVARISGCTPVQIVRTLS